MSKNKIFMLILMFQKFTSSFLKTFSNATSRTNDKFPSSEQFPNARVCLLCLLWKQMLRKSPKERFHLFPLVFFGPGRLFFQVHYFWQTFKKPESDWFQPAYVCYNTHTAKPHICVVGICYMVVFY